MILGGDELGRTQDGNNNAYCQDDELSWYDWAAADQDLLAFTRTAIALRRENPSFRPPAYLSGEEQQILLCRPDGDEMGADDWDSGLALTIGLDGRKITDDEGETVDSRFFVLVNASPEPVEFTVPSRGGPWHAVLTTGDPGGDEPLDGGAQLTLADRSLLVLRRD